MKSHFISNTQLRIFLISQLDISFYYYLKVIKSSGTLFFQFSIITDNNLTLISLFDNKFDSHDLFEVKGMLYYIGTCGFFLHPFRVWPTSIVTYICSKWKTAIYINSLSLSFSQSRSLSQFIFPLLLSGKWPNNPCSLTEL